VRLLRLAGWETLWDRRMWKRQSIVSVWLCVVVVGKKGEQGAGSSQPVITIIIEAAEEVKTH